MCQMLNIWHIWHTKHKNGVLSDVLNVSKFCNSEQYPHKFGTVWTKCDIWFIIFLFDFSLSSHFFNWFFLSPHNLSLSPNWCLWEPKMCRHAWQRPRHAWQRPRHALQRPRHAFLQGPRSPTSKKNPPTCCLISCEVKGVVYHQVSICVGMLDNS